MAEVERYYIEYGNTVRKINEPLPSLEERRLEEQILREQESKRKERKNRVFMRRSKLKTVYFIIAMVPVVFTFLSYVHMQTSVQKCKRDIAVLEGEISDLRAKNMSKRNRINAKTNLEAVKEVATKKLGMNYATPDKIVYYNIKHDDYMSQYKELP
jgi:hypothetical protein